MKRHALRSACFIILVSVLLPANAVLAQSTVELGFTYFYFDYKEDLPAPFKSTETGWLPGVYGSYEFSKRSNFYAKLFLSYAAGDVNFDGTTQDGTPLSFSDSRQRIFKFEGDIGYNVPAGERTSLIPFFGYGYRYWERGRNRITSTFTEYQEDYSWSYIPVGIKLNYAATEKLSVGITAQANFMFDGRMTAHTSDVGVFANDAKFDLGSKIGYYVELPIRYNLTNNLFLSLAPWYEYSRIGESSRLDVVLGREVIGYVYEPASRTHWYGFNAGVGYRF